jgi:hypothetical protein
MSMMLAAQVNEKIKHGDMTKCGAETWKKGFKQSLSLPRTHKKMQLNLQPVNH